MKLTCNRRPVPRDWSKHPGASGVVFERDIAITSSRLRAKLLVFKDKNSLHKSWHAILGHHLGAGARGAVNSLIFEVRDFKKGVVGKARLEADPRYFCVIGLIRQALSMEIICHEAVHAGFCFAKRKARTPWDVLAKDMDEESICYPAGRIAAEINRALYRAKMFSAA